MHASAAVKLACTDCHGGDGNARTKDAAHVKPLHPEIWKTSANPQRSYTALLQETPEFVKFINPGDLRVSQETCGGCHQRQVNAVPRSTMTTSAVFWAAVSYANGLVSRKQGLLGESYNRAGNATAIKPATPPTPDQIAKGALPILVPLPRWEIFQPAEYFRAFERGGISGTSSFPDIGNPVAGRRSRQARHPPRQSRPRHRPAHLARAHQSEQDAAQRSASLLPRHERSSRRLPFVRLHGMPRRLRQRSRSAAFRGLRAVRQHRPLASPATNRFRRTSRDIRCATSSRAPCRPASACRATCISRTPS